MKNVLKKMPQSLLFVTAVFALIPPWSLSFLPWPWDILRQNGAVEGALLLGAFWIGPLLLCLTVLSRSFLALPVFLIECVLLVFHVGSTAQSADPALSGLRIAFLVIAAIVGAVILSKDSAIPFMSRGKRFWRLTSRVDYNKRLSFRTPGGASIPVVMQDCSLTGMGLVCSSGAVRDRGELLISMGTTVQVDLRKSEQITAKIVWFEIREEVVQIGLTVADSSAMADFIRSLPPRHAFDVKHWLLVRWTNSAFRRAALVAWGLSIAGAVGTPACGRIDDDKRSGASEVVEQRNEPGATSVPPVEIAASSAPQLKLAAFSYSASGDAADWLSSVQAMRLNCGRGEEPSFEVEAKRVATTSNPDMFAGNLPEGSDPTGFVCVVQSLAAEKPGAFESVEVVSVQRGGLTLRGFRAFDQAATFLVEPVVLSPKSEPISVAAVGWKGDESFDVALKVIGGSMAIVASDGATLQATVDQVERETTGEGEVSWSLKFDIPAEFDDAFSAGANDASLIFPGDIVVKVSDLLGADAFRETGVIFLDLKLTRLLLAQVAMALIHKKDNDLILPISLRLGDQTLAFELTLALPAFDKQMASVVVKFPETIREPSSGNDGSGGTTSGSPQPSSPAGGLPSQVVASTGQASGNSTNKDPSGSSSDGGGSASGSGASGTGSQNGGAEPSKPLGRRLRAPPLDAVMSPFDSTLPDHACIAAQDCRECPSGRLATTCWLAALAMTQNQFRDPKYTLWHVFSRVLDEIGELSPEISANRLTYTCPREWLTAYESLRESASQVSAITTRLLDGVQAYGSAGGIPPDQMGLSFGVEYVLGQYGSSLPDAAKTAILALTDPANAFCKGEAGRASCSVLEGLKHVVGHEHEGPVPDDTKFFPYPGKDCAGKLAFLQPLASIAPDLGAAVDGLLAALPTPPAGGAPGTSGVDAGDGGQADGQGGSDEK